MLQLKYLISLLFVLIQTVLFGQRVSQTDSLWFVETGSKINQYINTNPKIADSLARLYFSKAKRVNSEEYLGKGASLVHMSVCVLDLKNAKQWYDTATFYLTRTKNYIWNGYLNSTYGNILTRQYSFESGITYLNRSIHYFELAKDTIQLAIAYSLIGNAFHNFGNYEKGKEYSFKGLKIAENIKSPEVHWYLFNGLAINYDDNKEYDKAITAHLKALQFAKSNEYLLASTYNNLGNTFKKKGLLLKANNYFQESYKISKQLKDDYQNATIFGNLSDIALKQKKYSIARNYLDSCLMFSEKTKSPEKLKDAYEYNANWYEETGDYRNALRYTKQYISLKDSLENVTKARIIYDAQERYESAKKEKENQELQLSNHLKTLEKERAISEKKNILGGFSIIIGLFSALAFFLYRNKLNRIRRAEEQKMNQALFEGEQKERIRIARDLHDSVGQMLSLAKMNLSAVKEEKLQPASQLIDNAISEIRTISHNLIPDDLNFGLFAALAALSEKVNQSGSTKMSITISDEVQNLKFEKQHELSIYRIIQEITNNMIRHAEANKIDLTITQKSGKTMLYIKDNGKGIDDGGIENSTGIGWKNIRARVNLLNGEMKVHSEKLIGTQIEIILPSNG